MSKGTPYYISTPIYYPTEAPHIGHCYCSVEADAIARFYRMTGRDAYFLTGTDEHGQKVEERARAAGMEPQEYIDMIVARFKELWRIMDVDYSDYLSTTQERHKSAVQRIFQKLYDKGHIYKGSYEGLYCTPCESYWTQPQLVSGKCPDCGREVKPLREEAYFLKISAYAQWLIDYIGEHPGFIRPASRANEMLQNFLLPGLEDLCVSRTTFKWGIPVPFDPKHVIYVWVDALSNYITALGYEGADDALFRRYWPAQTHLVGKEIIRFHTIVWPIMLKMLDLPQPETIYGHGWWSFHNDKMSKSKGNVIDPSKLEPRYGSDALRYFLLREMPLGQDANFTNELLITRINTDLANDLGNLISRTVAMVDKYFGGEIPEMGALTELEAPIAESLEALRSGLLERIDNFQVSQALGDIFAIISRLNKYIDQSMPWQLAKSPDDKERLGTVLYTLLEGIRISVIALSPFMPKLPEKVFDQIGVTDESLKSWDSIASFGALKGGRVKRGEALFPRLDMDKELEELDIALGKKGGA